MEFLDKIQHSGKREAYLILAESIPGYEMNRSNDRIPSEDELFELLESFIYCIKNGVQIFKPDKILVQIPSFTELLSDVARVINPLVLIISDEKPYTNNQLIENLNEYNLKNIR